MVVVVCRICDLEGPRDTAGPHESRARSDEAVLNVAGRSKVSSMERGYMVNDRVASLEFV